MTLPLWVLLAGCTPEPAEVVVPPRVPRPREPLRITGTEHALVVEPLPEPEQKRRAVGALLAGEMPAFLDQLASVELRHRDAEGRLHEATAWVTVDYLSVGTDEDHLIVPLDLPGAMAVARDRGMLLPTPKLVDAIWEQADLRITPDPMPPGDHMRSMAYSLEHRDRIAARMPRFARGLLVAGHKKDLVLSKKLLRRRQRVAIYGWHRPDGTPIQPVSTWHGESYADYSHGVRLVSEEVVVDGEPMNLYDVLADPVLSGLFSDEGPLPVERLMR